MKLSVFLNIYSNTDNKHTHQTANKAINNLLAIYKLPPHGNAVVLIHELEENDVKTIVDEGPGMVVNTTSHGRQMMFNVPIFSNSMPLSLNFGTELVMIGTTPCWRMSVM